MTSYFSNGCSDLDEIRQPDAEWHTDYGEMVDGGRLYFETGSSYISAANWDMSTIFGLLIDFDILKAVTSINAKPEVLFSGRGHHLEKWIWRHISGMGTPIWTKFGMLMQNKMQITGKWSTSKPEEKFQYGGRLFFQTRSSYISAIIWYMSTKFGLLIDLTFWRQGHQQMRNRK